MTVQFSLGLGLSLFWSLASHAYFSSLVQVYRMLEELLRCTPLFNFVLTMYSKIYDGLNLFGIVDATSNCTR